jgi:putative hydrolase of the HAD superfamily
MDIRIDPQTTVAFDLDDTLYAEFDFLSSAYRNLARTLDPGAWTALYARMLSGYRAGENVFARLEAEFGRAVKELLQLYREHEPDIRLRPGVLQVLQAIKANGGQIAVITDGRSSTQRNKIRALGLESWLDCLVISEEVGSEKPDERNFRRVEAQLGGTRHYWIADNPAKDFVTPNRMGWTSIALLDDGRHIHATYHKISHPDYLPHGYVGAFDELQVIGIPLASDKTQGDD